MLVLQVLFLIRLIILNILFLSVVLTVPMVLLVKAVAVVAAAAAALENVADHGTMVLKAVMAEEVALEELVAKAAKAVTEVVPLLGCICITQIAQHP
jgi:cobyrinic acid a,c-diamide synthase